MKKETSFKLILSFLLISFLISILSQIISAPNSDDPGVNQLDQVIDQQSFTDTGKSIGQALKGIGLIFGGIITEMFGGEWAYGTRILFFILLWLIIWNILPFIIGDEHPYIVSWASAIIAFIAIISIPKEFLDVITLQYGAMGAAVLSVIPFLIIFVFSIRMRNALGARVLWIFYSFYYIGLFVYRIIEITQKQKLPLTSLEALAYIIAIVAGILMATFLMGTIRHIFFRGELSAMEEEAGKYADIKKLLKKANEKEAKAYSGGAGFWNS